MGAIFGNAAEKFANRFAESETARNNRIGMTIHGLVDISMIVFMFFQFAAGRVSVAIFAGVVILGLGPIGAEVYYWKKNHETNMIKHCLAIGYAIFYTFTIFTSKEQMIFSFVIPMIVIVSIYHDVKYVSMINTGVFIENITVVLVGQRTGLFGYVDKTTAGIQMTILVLMGLASLVAARTTLTNFEQKLFGIESIQNRVNESVKDVNQKLEKLNESSKMTKTAVEEVNKGVADTAVAVQNQLLQTESIQDRIDLVSGFSAEMELGIQDTLQGVSQGEEKVTLLVEQADESVEISKEVAEKLDQLKNNMKSMNAITKLIDDIAFQTNIMALNANVEAARAGEVGRGFAVVASQVSSMSAKTKDATDEIGDLISLVSKSLEEVVDAVNRMTKVIEKEKENTDHTSQSFSLIKDNAEKISEKIEMLVTNMESLASSNKEIVSSIQTISASSEQVSALTCEAVNSENMNANLIGSISGQMEDLVASL